MIQLLRTLVSHLHVVHMLNVMTEFVHVFLNIKAIHTQAVGLNVLLAQIVQEIRLAYEINALTLAPEPVALMLFVR